MIDKKYTNRLQILTDIIRDSDMDKQELIDRYSFVLSVINQTKKGGTMHGRRNSFNSLQEFNQAIEFVVDTVKETIKFDNSGTLPVMILASSFKPLLTRLYINWFNPHNLDQIQLFDSGEAIGEQVSSFVTSTYQNRFLPLSALPESQIEAIEDQAEEKKTRSAEIELKGIGTFRFAKNKPRARENASIGGVSSSFRDMLERVVDRKASDLNKTKDRC